MKSYTKKDFEVQWFSGTGKGGQHRNKHQNCCRIIHIETGLRCNGTSSRERSQNQREAFTRLAQKLIALDMQPKERNFSDEVVRTYHFERGEVIDNSTGIRASISEIMNGDLDKFLLTPDRENERPRSGRA